jgi:hypothetical protein
MKITKGNSRLLFDSQQLDSIDISKSISDIDLKIEGSTQLQLATDEIILVFSSNPNSQDFPSSQIKIGREVLGFDSNVLLFINIKIFQKEKSLV